MERVEDFLVRKPTKFSYFSLYLDQLKNKKIVNQLILAFFLILNSNLFSDLMYHKRFDRYLNCTYPQNQNL